MLRNLGLLILAVCFSHTILAQAIFDETYSDANTIQLDLSTGDLVLEKSTTNETKVYIEYDASEREIKVKDNGGTLKIAEKNIKKNTSNGSSWKVSIPAGVNLTVNGGTSAFEIKDIDATVTLNTGTGKISLENTAGNYKVSTGTGNVYLTNAKGNYACNSGTGKVSAENSAGKFVLNSGTGNVEMENSTLDGPTTLNSGTGSVKCKLGSVVNHNLNLASGTGKASLDFNGHEMTGTIVMEANQRSGSISAPFKFDQEEILNKNDKSKRNRIMRKTAKLGGGGNTIKVSTGTGTASVKK